jgi:hypothetical protein
MKLTPKQIDMYVWVFIYGGLIFVSFGLAILTAGVAGWIGWGSTALGVVFIAVGIALIVLRSHVKS